MKQRIAVVLSAVCLMLSVSTVSYASEGSEIAEGSEEAYVDMVASSDGIQPYYINTSNIAAALDISGRTAYCGAEVFAKKVCSIKVVLCLQHKEEGTWVNKISWASTSTAGGKTMYQSYDLIERGSYRVKVYATVGGEEVTCTSVTKTY